MREIQRARGEWHEFKLFRHGPDTFSISNSQQACQAAGMGMSNVQLGDQLGAVALDSAATRERFVEMANYRMPFGKYKGRRLLDLPEAYLIWFIREGLPPGKLGTLMQAVYEVKLNELEHLFDPAREPGR